MKCFHQVLGTKYMFQTISIETLSDPYKKKKPIQEYFAAIINEIKNVWNVFKTA